MSREAITIDNGHYFDLSNEDYHASTAISRSQLMDLKQSPAHFYYNHLNTTLVEKEQTPAMLLGSVVHTLALEPALFDKEYIVKPELVPLPVVGKLKDLGREEYDKQKAMRAAAEDANNKIMEAFNAETEGKTVLDKTLFDQAANMVEALKLDDMFSSLTDDSTNESSIFFTHEPTGIQCRVRPDILCGSIVADLKTAFDASYRTIQNECVKRGYFLQAGMTKVALKSIGIELEKFVLLPVEKKEPFAVAAYILDDAAIDYGVDLFNELMDKLLECRKSQRWPAYEMKLLTVPTWANYL